MRKLLILLPIIIILLFLTMGCTSAPGKADNTNDSTEKPADSGNTTLNEKCDYSDEWTRRYLHKDPEICKEVKFQCIPNRKPFSDECGCGCELIDKLPGDVGDEEDGGDGGITSTDEKSFCTPAQRKAQFCTQVYMPVCGWNDPERIQCIRYPCAETYSNSCFACMNENVLYWTDGECPKFMQNIL